MTFQTTNKEINPRTIGIVKSVVECKPVKIAVINPVKLQSRIDFKFEMFFELSPALKSGTVSSIDSRVTITKRSRKKGIELGFHSIELKIISLKNTLHHKLAKPARNQLFPDLKPFRSSKTKVVLLETQKGNLEMPVKLDQ